MVCGLNLLDRVVRPGVLVGRSLRNMGGQCCMLITTTVKMRQMGLFASLILVLLGLRVVL